MIDVSKCEFDDYYANDEGEFDYITYYFTYPVDFDEAGFCKDDYENVVSMELSLTYEGGDFYMEMSPTVETKEGLTDVDWKELHENINYNLHTLVGLMQIVTDAFKEEFKNAYFEQSAC